MVDEAELNTDLPAVGRNKNVVYSLPPAVDSVPLFLQTALERIDPAAGGTQLVVITPDPEVALAISEAVLAMTGLGGIEVLPVTTAPRARRLLALRPVLAIAGPAVELQALLESTTLKLDTVRTVVLAWPDDTLRNGGRQVAAMEALLADVPKDAARVLVARTMSPEMEELVERYMRRARRETVLAAPASEGTLELRYITVSAASRPSALRRLLDEVDPPSAVVVTRSSVSELEARNALRRLGYSREQDPVRLASGDIPANAHTVILYEAPISAAEIARIAEAAPVQAFTLVQTRELDFLRSLPGLNLIPHSPAEAVSRARAADAAIRSELKSVLEEGIISREIIAIEPLLEEYDAVEIAAASLRLLERARQQRDSVEKNARNSAAQTAAPAPAPGNAAEMKTIFLTIGKVDGVRAGDIVGAIAGEVGIPGSSIGRVEILDKHSLVEIQRDKAQEVITRMNGSQIRGRKLAVREERERPPRRDRAPGNTPPRKGPPRDRGDRPSFDRGRRPRG